MGHRKIKIETLKRLLARSGNKCSFPNCTQVLFNNQNRLIAQLCHIEAVSPGGPRYNKLQTDEQRNDYENLLFLCYPHHRETDDENKFPVTKLKQIKNRHERKYRESKFDLKRIDLIKLKADVENYWNEVEIIHKNHELGDLKVDINFDATFEDLCIENNKMLKALSGINRFFEKSDYQKYFEVLALLLPNNTSKISINILQMKILFLEQKLKLSPRSNAIKSELRKARDEFREVSEKAIYFD